MTVEVVEPGDSTVVEAISVPAPVLEIHTSDAAMVEVLEVDRPSVEVMVPAAPAVVEVSAPEVSTHVEVVEQPANVVEVHAGSGDGGGVVTWDAIVDKPVFFPPDPSALEEHINDPTPHPAYDRITPSLLLTYENGLI